MSRKYEQRLVDAIKNNQSTKVIQEVPVIVKPIPDVDIDGAMDPRLYKTQRLMSFMLKFIPKRFIKMDLTVEGISKLRKPFNNIDSTPFVTGVSESKFTIKTEDGYDLPLTRFESDHTVDNAPILYFIHGGGFFAGRTDVVAEALRYIVNKTGAIAIGVDYRLAPENPYPIGHQDTYTALKWIYNNADSFGGDKNQIYVAGDSAGGNLTAYCSNKNIEEGLDMVRGQILLYPTVNMAGIKDKYSEFSIDKFNIYEKQRKKIQPGIEMFGAAFDGLGEILGVEDTHNLDLTPYIEVSPKMPKTLVTCGEHDALLIESLAYAKKLIDAGVDTTFTMYQGLGHAYIDHMGNFPQSEDCANDISDFIMKEYINE